MWAWLLLDGGGKALLVGGQGARRGTGVTRGDCLEVAWEEGWSTEARVGK